MTPSDGSVRLAPYLYNRAPRVLEPRANEGRERLTGGVADRYDAFK
jgi:hypothetical protein